MLNLSVKKVIFLVIICLGLFALSYPLKGAVDNQKQKKYEEKLQNEKKADTKERIIYPNPTEATVMPQKK